MTTRPPLMVSGDEVRGLITLDDALASQRAAFIALEQGEAQLAPRSLLSGDDDSVVFAYLARAGRGMPAVAKVGSVNPLNSARGLPGIHAVVLVLDPDTGELRAIVDGESVTLLRTAAATVMAVEALVAEPPATVGIVGSGPLAVEIVRFLHHVAPDCRVRVHARSPGRVTELSRLAESEGLPLDVVDTARDAVEGASVAICATNSVTPVVDSAWLSAARLLVSLGSFAPGRCEIGAEVLSLASRVVVDDVAASSGQCGPVVDALSAGSLTVGDLVPLGRLLTELTPAPPSGLTVFCSVGLGVQDAALAALVVRGMGEAS